MASLPGKGSRGDNQSESERGGGQGLMRKQQAGEGGLERPPLPQPGRAIGRPCRRAVGDAGDQGRAHRPHGHGGGMVPAALPGSVPGGG